MIDKIYMSFRKLSKQLRDSIVISMTITGIFSTILSILGFSLKDLVGKSVFICFFLFCISFIVICISIYIIIGKVYKESIKLMLRGNSVVVSNGNIFEAPGMRIIGCDTHFDTRVDDIVIAKKSLHGQLILHHSQKNELDVVVEKEAQFRMLKKDHIGLYNFQLGTVIRYDSSIDGHTYLLLAMSELNDKHEAHSDMANFLNMLMKMWKEIDRIYAGNNVALPLLGRGMLRFDDGIKSNEELLKYMLLALESSGVTLKSKIHILINEDDEDISLYEFKDIFRSISRR